MNSPEYTAWVYLTAYLHTYPYIHLNEPPSPSSEHRLLEIAPHYYDLSNFPKGETKNELEACAKRVFNL